jgi:hypothetical protein
MTGIGPGHFPADDNDDSFGRQGESGAFGREGAGEDQDDAEVAATFHPVAGGAACYFAPAQAGVIRGLVGQVAELITTDPGAAGSEPGSTAATSTGGDSPDDLEEMLGLSSNAELPDDPVLARLLPNAYSDDPQASAEFRRYTEESLRAGKINSAQAVLASLPAGGGEVVLTEPECQQWLKALNDVRLALGVRLGITDENEDLTEDLSVDDPRAAYIWVYHWLAYLQDSLIESLT